MRHCLLATLLVALLASCEEGPDQIYKPNPPNFDRNVVNGINTKAFVDIGDQPFQVVGSGQKSGTVKICEADELAKRWTDMVKQPIVPTHGAGGLDLRGKDWAGLTIDAAQQQLCQAYVYGADLYAWGDNAELISFFDTKTRLIYRLVTLTGYEGTITFGPFEVANNKPIMKDGKPISEPTAEDVLRQMNVELLKAFRTEIKDPDQRDCVALGTCFVMDWYTLKRFVFNDVQLDFATDPDKKINHVGINLQRNFEFGKGNVGFIMIPAPAAGLPPFPKIEFSASCHPTLGDTWDHIRQNCLGLDPEAKAQARPVWGNEAMAADMGGLGVYMVRPGLAADKIIPDGDRPQPTDEIVGMMFGSTYEGKLKINRADLLSSFSTALASEVKVWAKTVDVLPKLQKLQPAAGDVTLMPLGTQKVKDCNAGASCPETTLLIRVASLVQEEVKTLTGSVPDRLMDPNFYVEVWLRQLLMVFNESQPLDPTATYFYNGDDTAQTLSGRLVRKLADGKRYALTVSYHNMSDQLLGVFFKRDVLRTEAVLYKNAELASAGVFSLSGLASSKSGLGLGKVLKPVSPAAVNLSIQRALVTVNYPMPEKPVEVLVAYHPKDSLSGYAIPVEGQRDLFVPAPYYGFSGNNVGAAFWTGDLDELTKDVILAMSSGSFYDKVTFCGVKVGLYDSIDTLLKSLPPTCERIIGYSGNGKFIYDLSTYVQTGSTSKIGLRLFVTAGRVSGAYYWME